MTVAELIERLLKFPPHIAVIVPDDPSGDYTEAASASLREMVKLGDFYYFPGPKATDLVHRVIVE